MNNVLPVYLAWFIEEYDKVKECVIESTLFASGVPISQMILSDAMIVI